MTKETAMQRIQKAEEIISKKQNTIAKKQKAVEKKLKELEALGFAYDAETFHGSQLEGFDKETADKIYWLACDVRGLESDIKRGQKDIAEKEAKLPEYRKALAEAEQVEKIIADEIPESMKEAKAELVKNWTEYDLEFQKIMYEDSHDLDYKEFSKKYPYSVRERYSYKSEEDFRKMNEKEATEWLIDFYYRVKDITGNITDCKSLRWGGKCLNGYVVGDKGKAFVQTIEAGGWNVQRWHLRVLVNEAR